MVQFEPHLFVVFTFAHFEQNRQKNYGENFPVTHLEMFFAFFVVFLPLCVPHHNRIPENEEEGREKLVRFKKKV